MTITTLTISANSYTSYASLTEANARLAVDPTRSAAWAALTDDQKSINLVAATNRLDLLKWSGSKSGGEGAQANAWPRTGVTYADGTAVAASDVPSEVADATALLAGSIALDATNANATDSGSNIKRVGAGSAVVENFRPTRGKPLADETTFALIQQFLSGQNASTIGGSAYGTDATSSFTDLQQGYGLSDGWS